MIDGRDPTQRPTTEPDRRISAVTTLDDPLLEPYRNLRDHAVRQLGVGPGGEGGWFIAEGLFVIERLLASGLELASVLCLERKVDAVLGSIESRDVAVLVGDRLLLEAVTGFDVHRGVLACAVRPAPLALDDLIARSSTLMVCEGLNNAENLGALFRTAAGLGIDGVVLDPTCTDPYYRRCVRVSMGESIALAHSRAEPWPTALTGLAGHGWTVVALTPAPTAESLDDVVASGRIGDKVAILLGAEGPGLSATALASATIRARIPMHRGTDSLNVAAAGAIALYALTAPTRGRRRQ